MKFVKHSLLLFIAWNIVHLAHAQSYWQPVTSEEAESILAESDRMVLPRQYELYRLDQSQLQQALAPAVGKGNRQASVQLPTPEGSLEPFDATLSSVMHPKLAARFPHIQSFIARKADDRNVNGRIGYTQKGFHAFLKNEFGRYNIESIRTYGGSSYYLCYYLSEMPNEDAGHITHKQCGVGSIIPELPPAPHEDLVESHGQQADLVRLRVYDLALSSTGEFSQLLGGTTDDVMAFFAELLDASNSVFMNEVAVMLRLIADADRLIFLDPATDGYSAPANLGVVISENQQVFFDAGVGQNEYDIGHAMIRLGGGGGTIGLAGGTVCTNNTSRHKSRGASAGNVYSNVYTTAVELFAHEVGHQFTCGHSWNNCPGNEEQLSASNAYEPGSGSTIMSYSGSCGPVNNVQFNSDPYYNIGSLEDFIAYSRQTGGAFCPNQEFTENNEPTVSLPLPDNVYIPINTPFELIATAQDENGDMLTYCWEQHDLGPSTDMGTPVSTSPLFRSFPPTQDSVRVFPNIEDLVNNVQNTTEVLPFYSRDLSFTCTVRDNNPEAGGTVWQLYSFAATESADGFAVASPNSGSEIWQAGQLQPITWNVANTDAQPVDTRFVDVYLSTDGGYTYPYQLASGIPNTGSAMVSIPDVGTSKARIKIKGHDNIFFDISDVNFTITNDIPGVFYAVSQSNFQSCLPTTIDFTVDVQSVGGYDSTFHLELISNLPTGVSVSYDTSEMMVNQQVAVTVNVEDIGEPIDLSLLWSVIAAGADTFPFEVQLEMTSTDFSDVALSTPVDGQQQVAQAPTFTWQGSPNADSYLFQIATNPAFLPSSIVEEANGLTSNTYSLSTVLSKGRTYYWRVLASNVCAAEDFILPYALTTQGQACITEEAVDVPISISANGTPTIVSTISFSQSINIDDINLLRLRGNHDRIKELDAVLLGPDGTRINLFTALPCPAAPFDLNLDDDSNIEVNCAQINSGISMRPEEELGTFIDTDGKGLWDLRISVNDNFGNGGTLLGWSLQLCGNVTLQAPLLVRNDTIKVRPGNSAFINTDLLEVLDEDSPDNKITYYLITLPDHGEITRYGTILSIGDAFSQNDLRNNGIIYHHLDSMEAHDHFYLSAKDDGGGAIPVTRMNVITDESAPSNTTIPNLPLATAVSLQPNPAHTHTSLVFEDGLLADTQMTLLDVNGRMLQAQLLSKGTHQHAIPLRLSAGVYVVRLHNRNSLQSFRLVVTDW